jgi:hypothetical protein
VRLCRTKTPGASFCVAHTVRSAFLMIHHRATENTDPGTARQDGGKSFWVAADKAGQLF